MFSVKTQIELSEYGDINAYLESMTSIRPVQKFIRGNPQLTYNEPTLVHIAKRYVNTNMYIALSYVDADGKEQIFFMKSPKRGSKLYAKLRESRLKYVAMAMIEQMKITPTQSNTLFITLTIDPKKVGLINAWINQSKYLSAFIRKLVEQLFGPDIFYLWTVECQNKKTHYPHIHLLVKIPKMLPYHLHISKKNGKIYRTYRLNDYKLVRKIKSLYVIKMRGKYEQLGWVDVQAVHSINDAIEYVIKYLYKSILIKEDELATTYLLMVGRRNWGASRNITQRATVLAQQYNATGLLQSNKNNLTGTVQYLGTYAFEDIYWIEPIYKILQKTPNFKEDPPPLIIIPDEDVPEIKRILNHYVVKTN